MNKKIWLLALLGCVLCLAGCGSTEHTETTTGTQNLSGNETTTMQAKQAIENYLAAANKDIKDQVVASGATITVDYIGRFDDTTVFDTSVEAIAKAAGIYATGRNYSEGLVFTAWAGQVVPGFDAGVIGMKLGETKTVKIPAAEAYGERRDDLIATVPLNALGDLSGATVGTKILVGEYQIPATITAITETGVTLDANPDMAGKDLIFDITIKAIADKN